MIDPNSRRLALHVYRVGVGLVERHDADARELARAAIDRPCADTIRALLDAGRDRSWLPSVVDALAQVGIAAAEDVLGDKIPPGPRWSSQAGMPPHMIKLFEDLADMPFDLPAVDAAAQAYAAAVVAAGGAYGHALAAVWRAWPRDAGGK